MYTRPLHYFFILLSVLLFTQCKNKGSEQQSGGNDSLYTGQKFNEHIRSTEAQTPEEERKGFRLPEGFDITLFASEPEIGKPINITFDAKGRMWVTQSFEYPFPAKPGNGKDRVTILEDTDGDGRADKFVHFNDTLNIPIGVLPVADGAMVYSIPNVYKFADANGDGKPESSKKMMGPFEVKDTHGMVNNFAWGYDGWIHACHGYSNRSTVAAADGDSIHLVSGNTIRFRPDGSHVEIETEGRINPFGLAYDEWGYLYSTDCHTSPLYQLIRHGEYTQWGKEEKMGFAPDMKPLEDEATALAGIAYYADQLYPEDYRGNFFIGDAVSSKVYRNSSSWKGSSPVGKKEETFVLSADPWFRPVDVKMGPDGALYIADFYNSIIGHYEVPLDHPKRDRIRGRIWRVTYKGKTNGKTDLTVAPADQLIGAFKSANLSLRLMAANELTDRIGSPCIPALQAVINNKDASVTEYVHSLWVMQRLGALTDDVIKTSAKHSQPVIRTHALRTVVEQKDTSSALYPLLIEALRDENPHVQRAAVETFARYPNMNTVQQLIAFRKKIPDHDSHMIYTVRLVLKNLLTHVPLMNEVASRQWKPEDAAVLSTVLIGVESPASGAFMLNYVKENDLPETEMPKAIRHMVRFVPQGRIDEVIATGQEKSKKQKGLEHILLKRIQEGIDRRGAKEPAGLATWAQRFATEILGRKQRAAKSDAPEKNEELHYAAELAGRYKMRSMEPSLADVLKDTSVRNDVRSMALRSLMQIDPEKNAAVAGQVLQDVNVPPDLKRELVYVLAEYPVGEVNKMLASISNAPPDLQQGIVMALASSANGKNLLFDKVRKGEIFARTLADPKVEERLMINISPAQKAVFTQLTANLEKIDGEKQFVINSRIQEYNALQNKPLPAAGEPVFVKNCSPCHSIKGNGGAIGPQLDGVGKWGVSPLTEKILDPNRNISENFRNYTLKLRDGKVLSGLYRRDEGQVIVFADATGKEFSVSKQEIIERKASNYTLMPDQFRNSIPVNEFYALISYLLSQK